MHTALFRNLPFVLGELISAVVALVTQKVTLAFCRVRWHELFFPSFYETDS